MCTCAVRDQIQSGIITSQQAFQRDVTAAYLSILPYVYSYIGVAVGICLVKWFENWCFSYTGAKLSRRVRSNLMSAILRQEIGWFDRDENSTGALISNLSINAVIVRGAVGEVFALVVTDVAIIVGCMIVAFTSGGGGWKVNKSSFLSILLKNVDYLY